MFDKLGSLGDIASSAAKQFGGEQKPEGENKAPATSEQKWNDLGGEVKKTVGEVQESRAKGENVDYAKLGNVAKQAATAYNSQENKNDLQGIGKSIAAGFMGGAQKPVADKPEGEHQQEQQNQEQHQTPPEPTAVPQQAPEPTPQHQQ